MRTETALGSRASREHLLHFFELAPYKCH